MQAPVPSMEPPSPLSDTCSSSDDTHPHHHTAHPPTQRAAVLWWVTGVQACVALCIGLTNIPFQELLRSLVGEEMPHSDAHASSMAGLADGTRALLMFALSPLFGWLSDRWGRKPMVVLSMAGSTLEFLLLACSESLVIVFLAKALSGICTVHSAALNATLADSFSGEERTKNFGLIGMAFGCGFVIGPALGGILSAWGVDPRQLFQLACVMTGTISVLCLLWYPETLPSPVDRERSSGTQPWTFWHLTPLAGLRFLFTHGALTPISLSMFVLVLGTNAVAAPWFFFTEFRLGWTRGQVYLSQFISGLFAIVLQGYCFRRMVHHLGTRITGLLSTVAQLVALLFMALAVQDWAVYVGLFFNSVSYCGVSVISGIMSKSVSPAQQGTLFGGTSSLQTAANSLSRYLWLGIFSWSINPTRPWLSSPQPCLHLWLAFVMSAANPLLLLWAQGKAQAHTAHLKKRS